jgi:hypothetical protein
MKTQSGVKKGAFGRKLYRDGMKLNSMHRPSTLGVDKKAHGQATVSSMYGK